MNKVVVGCGAICAIIGVIAIVFGIASKSLVLSAARITIKTLVSPQSFEKAKADFQHCSAYEEQFQYPFDKLSRKFKAEDFKDKCQSRAKTHYYLYHLKNEQGVMNGELPQLEQRGPWVFKTEFRGYTLEEALDGKALSETSRSWSMIDEAETAKLCPKCATDKLCVSWDYSSASAEEWPTSCNKGTRAGDASYNAITHPNPGYIGLLNLLELIPGADEKFIVYLFGSQAIATLFGPTSAALQGYTYQVYQALLDAGAAIANAQAVLAAPTKFSGNCSAPSFSLSANSAFQNQGMIHPIELDCFLRMPDSAIGSAAQIPRKLTGADLEAWSNDKRKQILWFITGADMVDGGSPTLTAPPYAGLNMGWAGIRWAALAGAYQGLSGIYQYVRAYNMAGMESLRIGTCFGAMINQPENYDI